jgi:Tol biopolymer transport system component
MRRCALLLIGVLASLASIAPPAGATFPGTNGKIAFWNFDWPSGQISTIESDGTGRAQLTSSVRRINEDPAWSPDGSTIAFDRFTRRGYSLLMTMASDGSNKTVVSGALTARRPYLNNASWSPDGAQILVSAGRYSYGAGRLYIVTVDGSQPPLRIPGAGHSAYPEWSPDGTKIAFVTGGQIGTMDPDGSNRTIVYNQGSNLYPSWSPDGSKIVFSHTGVQHRSVETIDADGSNPVAVYTTSRGIWGPKFSPDGTLIVFSREQGNSFAKPDDLWVMNSDGSNVTQLTDTPRKDEFVPNWQPT